MSKEEKSVIKDWPLLAEAHSAKTKTLKTAKSLHLLNLYNCL